MPASSNRPSLRRQKIKIGLNIALALLLAIILWGMVNFLASKNFWRKDLSREKFYALSDKSLSLLASVTEPLDIAVCVRKTNRHMRDIEYLLKEYASASDRIHFEYVDPDRDLARTELLVSKYGLKEIDVIVFASGDRRQIVSAGQLEATGETTGPDGTAPRKVYRGEQLFTSAIHNLIQAERPVVYVLAGHGEKSIEDFEPVTGLAKLAERMERENVKVETLLFGDRLEVPENCSALLIPGPDRKISQPEIDLLQAYLKNEGRMMILLDALVESGLEDLLLDWGVLVGDDLVVDKSTLTGREVVTRNYHPHPITDNLRNVSTIFYLPRSVEPRAAEPAAEESAQDRPRVLPLISSTPHSWAETDPGVIPVKRDPDRDRAGPITLAVAVERGPAINIDVSVKPTRLVVMGDSDFIANGRLAGGAEDLVLNGLNWLLNRNALLAIPPKPVDEIRLVMNKAEMDQLFWAVVVGLPAGAAFLGFLVWTRRRT